MLKSIAVVAGSYLLSVVLMMATDPLLTRLVRGDFVRGRIPSNSALLASKALFVVVSILIWLALCSLCSQPALASCLMVLYHWGSRGSCRRYSQLAYGWPRRYWSSWIFSWPLSCWIGLIIAGRRAGAANPAANLQL